MCKCNEKRKTEGIKKAGMLACKPARASLLPNRPAGRVDVGGDSGLIQMVAEQALMANHPALGKAAPPAAASRLNLGQLLLWCRRRRGRRDHQLAHAPGEQVPGRLRLQQQPVPVGILVHQPCLAARQLV